MPDKIFKVGEDILDIPEVEVQDFLTEFPEAQEVQRFTVGEDTLNIPIDQVDDFKEEFPEAQTLNPEPEPKKTNFFGDALKAFQAGSASLGQMIAETPGFIFDVFAIPQNIIAEKTGLNIGTSSEQFAEQVGLPENEVSKFYGEQVEILKEDINKKYDKGITELVKEGRIGDAIKSTALQVAESAPITIGLMLGNAAGLTPLAGTIGGGAVFGAGEAEQLEGNENVTQSQQTFNSLAKGFFEGAFEQLGVTKLGSIYKDVLEKQGKEAADEIIQKGFQEAYTPIIKKYGVIAAEEAISEAATRFSQNAITKFTGEDPNIDLTDGVADAAIVGLGSSVVFSGPGAALEVTKMPKSSKVIQNTILDQPSPKEISELVAEENVGELENRLGTLVETKDISPEKAENVLSEIEKFKQINSTIPETIEGVEKRAEVARLIDKREQLKSQEVDDLFQEEQEKRIADVDKQIRKVISGKEETKQPSLLTQEFDFVKDADLIDKIVELPVTDTGTLTTQVQEVDAITAQNNLKDQLSKLRKAVNCL